MTEVTNTPWKERHRYPVALSAVEDGFKAEFVKRLHVSPFLDSEFRYELRLADRDDRVALDIDVLPPGQDAATVHTALRLRRNDPTRQILGRTTWRRPHSTRQVSAGIHIQAARLVRKGVPFVKHPKKNETQGLPA